MSSVHLDTVKVRVYIEGVLFPYVKTVTVTEFANSVRASIEIPPSYKLKSEILTGAKVHIFYANSRVLAKFGGDQTQTLPSGDGWPILFQGEIMGEAANNSVASEGLVLQCVSHSRHFDQTMLYFYDPVSANTNATLSATVQASFIGNTSIQLEMGGLLSRQSQILNTLTENLEAMNNGDPGRNIAFSVLALSIFKEARERHALFGTFDDQLKLSSRFGIYADPDVKRILKLTQLKHMIEQRISKLPAYSSLMQVLELSTNIMQYNWNEIAQPSLRQNVKFTKGGSFQDVRRKIERYANIVANEAPKKPTLVAGIKIPADLWTSANRGLGKARVDVDIDEFVLQTYKIYTADGFIDKFKDDATPTRAVKTAVEQALSKGFIPRKKKTNKGKAGIGNVTLKQAQEAANTQITKSQKEKRKSKIDAARKAAQEAAKVRDELNQFVLTPNMQFSHPPRNNVIFPGSMMTYGINRNYMQEITRLYAQVAISPALSGGAGLIEWYIAPLSQAYHLVSDKNVSGLSEAYNKFIEKNAKLEFAVPERNFNAKTLDAVYSWLPDVKKAKAALRVTHPEVDAIDDALVLAFIQNESSGRVNVGMETLNGRETAASIRQKKKITKRKGRVIRTGYGRRTIVGGFQARTLWYNDHVARRWGFKTLRVHEYLNRIYNNKFNQVYDFLLGQIGMKHIHHLRPDLMAIAHSRCSFGTNGGAGYTRSNNLKVGKYGCIDNGTKTRGLISQFSAEQQVQIKSGQAVSGDLSRPVNFAYNWKQPGVKNSIEGKHPMFSYPLKFQRMYKAWAKRLGQPDPTYKNVVDWEKRTNAPSPKEGDTIFGKLKKAIVNSQNATNKPSASKGNIGVPFVSGRWVTPEEIRKGIIAQVFHINDWHLAQLDGSRKGEKKDGEKESALDRAIKSSGFGKLFDELKDPSYSIKNFNAAARDEKGDLLSAQLPAKRADLAIDQRRLYIQSIVEAEFYRRRYGSRSTPPISGPFNPYPVAGFPGLIMNPVRPILGYIDSVTHSIDVAGSQGTTSVSFTQPRYWDEGEVWHWIGGYEITTEGEGDIETDKLENRDESPNFHRRFPQWHNRFVVPTNNYSLSSGKYIDESDLDDYYQFMLGTRSVEYFSNHGDVPVQADAIKRAIEKRDPGKFEVNPETLEILEYNKAIAKVNEKTGRFQKNTLAERIYGEVPPSIENRPIMSIDEQQAYNERYGVRERELLERFLGNKFKTVNGRVVCVGPTFNQPGAKNINSIQQHLIGYMNELESRKLEGGW